MPRHSPHLIPSRGRLLTEQRLSQSVGIDRASIAEAFDILNAQDRTIAYAVAAAKRQIVRATALVAHAWQSGGRLFYVGAGTSGRLGVLDAAECPPTFRSPPKMVQGIIAGGRRALQRAVEGAEDNQVDGGFQLYRHGVGPRDVVMGIAAGGTTPFVHGALHEATRLGARTIFLACVPRRHVQVQVDVDIRVLTGPEALTGSTRMKAGLATKMVLNCISTIGMIQLGKTYENLMVDLNSRACRKLTDRATRVIQTITGLDRDQSARLLSAAHGHVKTALVMHVRQLPYRAAVQALAQTAGHVRPAMTAAPHKRQPRKRPAGR